MGKLASAGYLLALLFLLLRCTRGLAGVPVVCDYTLGHWSDFSDDFDVFCKGLAKHYEQVCRKSCAAYLSHREGLHTKLSGIFFLRTLRNARSIRRSAEGGAQQRNADPPNSSLSLCRPPPRPPAIASDSLFFRPSVFQDVVS